MLRKLFAIMLAASLALPLRGESGAPGTNPKPTDGCPKAVELCAHALDLRNEEIKAMQKLLEIETKQGEILKKQRDSAVEALGDRSDMGIPWWVWGVVGVAGGVILTRGLR